ncbi:hypothetical protein BJ912DRAFT_920043 [Pholiota molesta]|nr:hypothetical protein BJ912DRAFT_920043 [Pholiota molesta]
MDAIPISLDEEDLSQFLISPTGSVFDALCTLNPPSPILTPSQLTFAWSSGDIPVLLYDDSYVDPLSELSDSSTSQGSPRTRNRRDSSSTLRSQKFIAATAATVVMDHNRESSRSSIFTFSQTDSAYGTSRSSESSTSVDSMGTFGPRSRRRKTRSSQVSQNLVDSESVKALGYSSLNSQNTATLEFDDLSGVHNEDFPRTNKQSRHALSGAFYHPVVFVDVKTSRKHSDLELGTTFSDLADESSSHGPFSEQIAFEKQSPENYDEDKGDMTMTPTNAGLKTLSWISSQSWDYGEYKNFITNKNLARCPHPTQIVEFDDVECNALPHVSPPRRKPLERHGHVRKLDNSSPSRVSQQTQVGQHHRREHSVKVANQAHPERPIVPSLDHDWLQDIYVQFLVDQEGFRDANIFFSFTGIVHLRPAQNLRTPGGVMAQFKPITRQAFHFHDAPFETPPILRRITVNGDDTHDYASKQALLTLKTNGVYVLHGHEISVANNHNNHDSEPLKLHWQFEYLVDDRIADKSGRVMEGEKILTPLTFSCAPGLLLPQQARKNNIMHVIKKGVAPKLVAEKLQPPGVSSPTNKGFSLDPLSSPPASQTEAHTHGFFSSKSHGWGLHRRGQSHGMRQAEHPKGSPNCILSTEYNITLNQDKSVLDIKARGLDSASTVHRRRNSSAEHNDSPMRLHFNTMKNSNVKHRRFTQTQKPTSPARHIISPAELTKLLDTTVKENLAMAAPQFAVPVVADRNSNNFSPLAPRPRHANVKSRDLARV